MYEKVNSIFANESTKEQSKNIHTIRNGRYDRKECEVSQSDGVVQGVRCPGSRLGEVRSQRGSHTLQPTALVHEAYLKMAKADAAWNDRTHFLATAARAMRQILVNHARDRGAAKRGGGVDRQRVTLSDVSEVYSYESSSSSSYSE